MGAMLFMWVSQTFQGYPLLRGVLEFSMWIFVSTQKTLTLCELDNKATRYDKFYNGKTGISKKQCLNTENNVLFNFWLDKLKFFNL